MKNRLFLILLLLFTFFRGNALADEITDLGEIKTQIGSIELTFCQKPESYEVFVSMNGDFYESIAKVTNNISRKKTEHNFTARDVRFIKIVGADGYISEVEAKKAQWLNAALVVPESMSGDLNADTEIKVKFGKTINSHYLDKVELKNGSGEVIKTQNTIAENQQDIILTPQISLCPGEYYTVGIKHFNKWGFGINSGASDGATGRILSSLSGLTYGSITNSIDKNEETYDNIDIWDRGKIFEYDLGAVYNNLSDIYLSFNSVPVLVEIYISEDGAAWNKAAKHYTMGKAKNKIEIAPSSTRYIRVCNVEGGMSIKEFKAYTAVEAIPFEVNFSEHGGELIISSTHQFLAGSINSDNIKLFKDNKVVSCQIVSEEKSVKLVPQKGFEPLEEYELYIDGVCDKTGRRIEDRKFVFNTKAEDEFEIRTVSDTQYQDNPQHAIYPVFVDNMPYEVWNENGKQAYYQINAVGGRKPYRFEITNGTLPEGLSLSQDGKISGKATLEGIYEFTVKVTDASGKATEKTLSMTANPYRSKWFADARFGVMTQWGVFSMSDTGYEMTKTTADIAAFEALIEGKFSAEEWAQQLYDMGARVFNWTVMAGDSIRMFPSRSDSAKGAKLTKNLAGDLIRECHERGIKFIGYVAPETSWANSLGDYDPATQSYSMLVVNSIKELLDMGMDGVWLDAGWSNSYVDWDLMLQTIRTTNPYATIQSNASVNKMGWIPMYPEVDIQTVECTNIDQTDSALHVAFKSSVEKKMAVEQTGLIGGSWGPSDRTQNVKSTDAIIENIQKNWDNGVTYMLVFNASVDGDLVHPLHKETTKLVTDWVKENINSCSAPTANLDENVVYEGKQHVVLSSADGTEIYYTTDGTNPDLNSIRYTDAISIVETTEIRAVAYIGGKRKSEISKFTFVINNTISKGNVFSSITADTFTNIEKGIMTGMFFWVKNNPLVINSIGKIRTDGESHYTVIYELGEEPIPVFSGTLSYSGVSQNGFAYADIEPIKLKANTNYYILVKENSKYIPLTDELISSANNEYIRVNDGIYTDISFTKYYYAKRENKHSGQPIDLSFDVLNNANESENLALNATAKLLNNSGNEIGASSDWYYAYNAVDGNTKTYAAANSYAWTLWLDLEKTKWISKMNLKFKEDLYSTSFEIYTSTDNSKWTKRYSKNNNTETSFEIPFYFTSARYVMVRSLLPDAKGQPGGQMFVSEVEIYE